MQAKVAFTALCVAWLAATVAAVPPSMVQCPAVNNEPGPMCNTSTTMCCGAGTMEPHCMPSNGDLQCCSHYIAAATCGGDDTCCGAEGPGASSNSFCCPPTSSCCRTTDFGMSSCCPAGSTCCVSESNSMCCGPHEQCSVTNSDEVRCVNKNAIPPPPVNPHAVPAGGNVWEIDATQLTRLAYIDGIVATVNRTTGFVVAIGVKTGKTLWSKFVKNAQYTQALTGVMLRSGRPAFFTPGGALDAHTGDLVYSTTKQEQGWSVSSVAGDVAVYWTYGGPLGLLDMTTGTYLGQHQLGNLASIAPERNFLTLYVKFAVILKCDLLKEKCSTSPSIPLHSAVDSPNTAASLVGSVKAPGWPFFVIAAGHMLKIVECGREYFTYNLTTTMPLPPKIHTYGEPCSTAVLTATNVVIAASCNGQTFQGYDVATKQMLWSAQQPIKSIARRGTNVQIIPFDAKYVLPNGSTAGAAIPDGAAIIFTDVIVFVSAKAGLLLPYRMKTPIVTPQNVEAAMVGPVSKPCMQVTIYPRVVCIDVTTGSVVWSGPTTSPSNHNTIEGRDDTSLLIEDTRMTAFKNA